MHITSWAKNEMSACFRPITDFSYCTLREKVLCKSTSISHPEVALLKGLTHPLFISNCNIFAFPSQGIPGSLVLFRSQGLSRSTRLSDIDSPVSSNEKAYQNRSRLSKQTKITCHQKVTPQDNRLPSLPGHTCRYT